MRKIKDLTDRELQEALLGNARRISNDINVIKVIIVVIISINVLAGLIFILSATSNDF